MEVVVANKFSEYLIEQGFYFANINNPKKTIYGQELPKETKSTAIDNPDESEEEKELEGKNILTNPQQKLTTYLQIVAAINN